jgi:hypothetical protein
MVQSSVVNERSDLGLNAVPEAAAAVRNVVNSSRAVGEMFDVCDVDAIDSGRQPISQKPAL